MKKEYDFKKAIRGKFYIKPEDMDLPIYLNKKNKVFFYNKADELGKTPAELVNSILSKEIDNVKTLTQ